MTGARAGSGVRRAAAAGTRGTIAAVRNAATRGAIAVLAPLSALALGAISPAAAAAQATPAGDPAGVRAAAGVVYRGFSLDPQLNAQSASLLLIPIAADMPIGRSLLVELYGAYARGSIERSGETLTLAGPVNANLRAVWSASQAARVTLGVSIPTGAAGRDSEEAIVASILATDLLGFREASLGTGAALTTGVAFAHQVGDWGVGWGGSYRLAGGFEPFADTALTYSPGSQLMLRVAGDRNVGASGKLTLGASYQHFAEDEFAANLFRPGPRVRADVAWSFRTGPTSTWSLFATDIWRRQSEATLSSGTIGSDTTISGSQNVIIVGAAGSLDLASMRVLPRADVRLLSREDGVASGWLAALGGALPLRLGTLDVLPRVQALFGAIEASSGERPGIAGLELELTMRWAAGRR